MRVREFIAVLSQLDPDALVIVENEDFIFGHYGLAASVEAGEIIPVIISHNVMGEWTLPKKCLRLAPINEASTHFVRIERTGEPSQAVVVIRPGDAFI